MAKVIQKSAKVAPKMGKKESNPVSVSTKKPVETADTKDFGVVRKLLLETKHGTAIENEIVIAMQMLQHVNIQRSVELHANVTLDDVTFAIIDDAHLIDEPKYWLGSLLVAISNCYSCKVVRTTTDDRTTYHVVGIYLNVELVLALYAQLTPVIRKLSKEHYKEYLALTEKDLAKRGITYDRFTWAQYFLSPRVFSRSYTSNVINDFNLKLLEDKIEYVKSLSNTEEYIDIADKNENLIDNRIGILFGQSIFKYRKNAINMDMYEPIVNKSDKAA